MEAQTYTESRKTNNSIKEISPHLEKCIEACTKCHQICDETIEHCLFRGGIHADPTHIRLLRDCAQISALAADFMLRDSEFHHMSCNLCADISKTCAEDSEAIDENDEMMKLCAKVCRECSVACQELSDLH
jgi:hypothetical protein